MIRKFGVYGLGFSGCSSVCTMCGISSIRRYLKYGFGQALEENPSVSKQDSQARLAWAAWMEQKLGMPRAAAVRSNI